MAQISQFLKEVDGGGSHYCPACKELHTFNITKPNSMRCQWFWDGKIVEPTFKPSMMIKLVRRTELLKICHYTITAGEIKFHDDCSHEFKGITMALPALPDYLRDKCLNF